MAFATAEAPVFVQRAPDRFGLPPKKWTQKNVLME
jgi:hypothetical protein